jgi:hypothetical protein
VFAVDAGTGSVTSVQQSPLLRRSTVTFVEGPTQLTLPRHTFSHPLQLVLLDGPHAYPFPDLEYYHLYPHLAPGGLLIVDDIHIPTVGNLFDFLSVDEMFQVEEVVGATAFFRRTDAPTFPTTGDGHETQRYNRRAFEPTMAAPVTGALPEIVQAPIKFCLDRLGGVENPSATDRPIVPAGRALDLVGWAVDGRMDQAAPCVDLVLDGVAFRAPTGFPRPDVVGALNQHASLRSGFNSRLPADVLTAGPHTLEIRLVLEGGTRCSRACTIRFDARPEVVGTAASGAVPAHS